MSIQAHTAAAINEADSETRMYVTMRIERQLFGIAVEHVRDVLRQQKITAVPLASEVVAGSLNLRGRIVTVIDVRKRLRLPPKEEAVNSMFVVVDHKGELYSLMVDAVGEVLTIGRDAIEFPPPNLDNAWKEISSGIHKLESELLVIADVSTLLTLKSKG